MKRLLNVLAERNVRSTRGLAALLLASICTFAFAQPALKPGELIQCEPVAQKPEARCTFMLSGGAAASSVSVSLQQQAVKSTFTPYPAQGQSTAVLMLVDISDPRRAKAVASAATLIKQVLAQKQPHHSIAIAQFDSALTLSADFGADEATQQAALTAMVPKGYATELYKSSLEAIALLKKTSSTRRALIIFSDGKAEDKGYRHEDVMREALAAQVMIFTVGYPESPAETPYLQTLERLAKESGGLHRVASTTDKSLPEDTAAQMLGFAAQGGTVTFGYGERIGEHAIELKIKLVEGGELVLPTTLSLPDNRPTSKKVTDHLKSYAALYVGGVGLLLVLLAILLWRRKRRQVEEPAVITYAMLEELSGQGITHRLQKQANRIGRAADNDVCLQNNSVSAYHAEINVRRDGSLVLIDLGSSNGTYLNDQKISSETVEFGTVMELGEVRLRLRRPD